MKTIQHVDTLVYYDGVQVFEGCDAVGDLYIGVMTGPEEGFAELDKYLIAKVKSESLHRFRAGAIDLRTLLLAASGDGWYLAKTNGDFEQPLALARQDIPLAETEFLPDAGFLLQEPTGVGDV